MDMINKFKKIRGIALLLSFCLFIFQIETFSQRRGEENGTFNYDIKRREWIRKYHNVYYLYHENGELNVVKTYDNDGNSNMEIFDENGIIRVTGSYNAYNKKNKTWNFQYDGLSYMIVNYDNGVLNGDFVLYYLKSETKLLECTFKNKKFNGEYKKYESV